MPSKKVKAIVTRAVAYNESDMIVTLVSVEEGKLTATVKGCLKPNAKLRYAASPMNFGEYVLADTHGRYIVTE
ncbi:MAG: recombination protein O N-terminal domain-containing protein, partial [Clostridia bacterium]